MYLYDYVPKNRDQAYNIKPIYKSIRQKIWDFKNGYFSSHSFFLQGVVDYINILKTQHPDKEIIIIPIPASTISKTNNRFKVFLETICDATNISNGFNYILNNSSSVAHCDGDRNKNFSLNPEFTINSDSIVILFDDVYTSGTAFRTASNLLENSVIEGIFLGQTIDGYDIFNFCD